MDTEIIFFLEPFVLWCLALKVNPSLTYLKTGGDAEIFLYTGVFLGGGYVESFK